MRHHTTIALLIAMAITAMCADSLRAQTAAPAVWQRAPLGYGGAGVIAVNARGTIFCGANREMARSADGGATWKYLDYGMPGQPVNAIIFNAAGDIFAGTEDGGIARSTDDGASWTTVTEGTQWYQVRAMAVGGDGKIFAAIGSHGIIRSADNGGTWQVVMPNSDIGGATVDRLASDRDGLLYAGTSEGAILVSKDGGGTWRTSMKPSSGSFVVTLATGAPGEAFAIVANRGVYRSSDRGATWSSLEVPGNQYGAFTIGVDGADNVYLGTWYKGLYRSTNHGADWAGIQSLGATRFTTFCAGLGSTCFTSSATDGILRSDDNGQSWRTLNSLNSQYVFQLLNNSANGSLYALSGWNLFRTTSNGDAWERLVVGDRYTWIDEIMVAGGSCLFARREQALWRSEDNGDHWESVAVPAAESLRLLAAGPTGEIYAWANSRTLLRSDDRGRTWITASTDPRLAGVISNAVTDMHGTLYLLTAYTDERLMISDDKGVTWQFVTLPHVQLRNMLTVDASGTIFISALNDGIYYTTDQGGTWKVLKHEPGCDGADFLVADDFDEITTDIFLDRSGDVKHRDGGGNWVSVGAGIPNGFMQGLILSRNRTLFVATDGGGVFRASLEPSGVDDARAGELADALAIEPNPVTNVAQAAFNLARAGRVRIELYNLTGQEVRALLDANMEAGAHTVRLATDGLPSGAYLMRLQTAGSVTARSVVISR